MRKMLSFGVVSLFAAAVFFSAEGSYTAMGLPPNMPTIFMQGMSVSPSPK